MTDNDAFRLSRIEAQGWNAAQRFLAAEPGDVSEAKLAKLNPHRADPERARWLAGFRNAAGAAK